MKRAIRTIWVVGVNGFVAWDVLKDFAHTGLGLNTRYPERWFVPFLGGVFPLLGIALELFNVRAARWANAGWLTLGAFFCLLMALKLHSPQNSWINASDILIGFSVGLLIAAVLTEIVYGLTRSKEPPTTDEMLEEMVRPLARKETERPIR